jgi:hypothetical protein
MSDQLVVGLLITVVGLLIAFVINTHRREIDELKKEMIKLREELHLVINQVARTNQSVVEVVQRFLDRITPH